jgi:hypothetical protein
VFPKNQLFFNRSVNGANVSASTARYALVCVDYKLAVALRNATGRACVCASAARNTIVCDFECHNYIPPNNVTMCILAYYRKKSSSFMKKMQN